MFEIILFSLVVVCAIVMLVCRFVFPSVAARNPEPWYLDYARSFFPVLLIVFLLRGFIAEPFRIPSGSMLPTLEVGDFILVNKFSYGLRLPILHKKIIEFDQPERGEIMVFRYPRDNKTNYIKRVIGVPGDSIDYRDKQLYINGQLIEKIEDGRYTPFPMHGRAVSELDRFKQIIPAAHASKDELVPAEYSILNDAANYGSRDRSTTVPEGHYFMLGDNRDHSQDSRYWGFVPDKNIVGRAFFIWFHYNGNPGGGFKLSRVGEDI
ncbi:MAG: signal peptidase I [Arenicella sp.]|jgi:signal peptidase I